MQTQAPSSKTAFVNVVTATSEGERRALERSLSSIGRSDVRVVVQKSVHPGAWSK